VWGRIGSHGKALHLLLVVGGCRILILLPVYNILGTSGDISSPGSPAFFDRYSLNTTGLKATLLGSGEEGKDNPLTLFPPVKGKGEK